MDELKIAKHLMKWRKAKGIECRFFDTGIEVSIRERQHAENEKVEKKREVRT